ncbi:MAG: adaptor protein MecA [Lachnospiraceae bacterium]|nr:adaptor protein MecA [Lachnospiraceae bacterium]MCR4597340.1 adaptor protein MecA [Lachnospiraceae bacterium]
MKLERMNEQQIRCTLTSEDLKARKIKISELAYGTDKARSLFRDMMIKAADELDFEVEEEPLMIEATPINSECIVLTVTKVDDPEELDTRFARFAPDLIEDKYDEDVDGADELSLFQGIEELADSLFKKGDAEAKPDLPRETENLNLSRLFSFDSIGDIISLSHVIAADYDGTNSIYKDNRSNRYLLLIEQSGLDIMAYNRICNIISEYGESEKNLLATQAYLEEHCELIIGGRGIQQLAQI